MGYAAQPHRTDKECAWSLDIVRFVCLNLESFIFDAFERSMEVVLAYRFGGFGLTEPIAQSECEGFSSHLRNRMSVVCPAVGWKLYLPHEC